jgi:FGGY family of carbohydrate kinases, N-terminal domain
MILAIDQGTTGTTCIVFDAEGRPRGRGYSEFAQHFPRPGWVEHDAAEIWEVTRKVAIAALADAGVQGSDLAGVGITNQRETVVAWDPRSREPVHRALVWQDRRTAARCDELREAGHEELIRERTGLVIDPYFSGTKIEWLLRNGDLPEETGVRDDRLLARLQAHRPPSDRLLERLADDALRHPQARLGRRVLRAARRRSGLAARAGPLVGGLRHHLALRRRGAGRRDRRRPAGGAVRAGLSAAGRGQEHLRHRELRAAQHGHRRPRSGRGPAHHRRLGTGR